MFNISTWIRTPTAMIGIMVALVICLVMGWTYNKMLASNARLELTIEEVEASQRKVADIQRWRHRPRTAALYESETPDGMTRLANYASRKSGLASTIMDNVKTLDTPEPTDDPELSYRLTTIELKGINLPQLVQYCEYIEHPDDPSLGSKAGLRVRGLDLKIPAGMVGGDFEEWDVTLTLTQTVFSPKS